MDIELKDVHVGQEIAKRIAELGITKTEFGNRIGVSQQHVNRILERETMETKKLFRVCRVLDMNIFARFCSFPTNVNAYLAAVTLGDGHASNNIGDAAALVQIEVYKAKLESSAEIITSLKEQIAQLKDQLRDKNALVEILSQKSSK